MGEGNGGDFFFSVKNETYLVNTKNIHFTVYHRGMAEPSILLELCCLDLAMTQHITLPEHRTRVSVIVKESFPFQ